MRWLTDIISSLVGVDIMNPHNIPFAAPLVTAALLGFIISSVILKAMDKEIAAKYRRESREDKAEN